MMFWEKQKSFIALYESETRFVCEKYGLTRIEYDIVMFLHNNPQYKTAADIVKMRRLAKSHVSLGVSLLERKGIISKHCYEGNRKSVILTITDLAKNLIEDGENAQKSFARKIFEGFSENEMKFCRKMLFRMYENASIALTQKRF